MFVWSFKSKLEKKRNENQWHLKDLQKKTWRKWSLGEPIERLPPRLVFAKEKCNIFPWLIIGCMLYWWIWQDGSKGPGRHSRSYGTANYFNNKGWGQGIYKKFNFIWHCKHAASLEWRIVALLNKTSFWGFFFN